MKMRRLLITLLLAVGAASLNAQSSIAGVGLYGTTPTAMLNGGAGYGSIQYAPASMTLYGYNPSGLTPKLATYTSGITATGSAAQTCTLTFTGGTTQAVGTVKLSTTNTVTTGSVVTFSTVGTGYIAPPVTATASNGIATCSGTVVVATALGAYAPFAVDASGNLVISGGGSGTVNSGNGYKIPAYASGAGTTVGPSNITTDSTGNNLNVPGTVAASTAVTAPGIYQSPSAAGVTQNLPTLAGASKLGSATAALRGDIIVIGDSIAAGSASTGAGYSWAGQVITQLQSVYGNGGMGFCSVQSGLGCSVTLNGAWTGVQTGPWQSGGPLYSVERGSGSLTASVGTGGPFNSDSMDIDYYTFTDTTAQFCVTVGAGTPTCFGGTTSAGYVAQTATVDIPFTGSSQTITITAPATGAMYLAGVYLRTQNLAHTANTGGMAMWNVAMAGMQAQAYSRSDAMNWLPFIPNPSIALVAIGANDMGTSTPAQVVAYHQNIFNGLKAAGIPEAMIIENPNTGSDTCTVSPCQIDYSNALLQFAAANNIPVVNMFARWRTWAAANAAGLMADSIHPNNNGHSDYAAAILGTLFPFAKGTSATGVYVGPFSGSYNPGFHMGNNVQVPWTVDAWFQPQQCLSLLGISTKSCQLIASNGWKVDSGAPTNYRNQMTIDPDGGYYNLADGVSLALAANYHLAFSGTTTTLSGAGCSLGTNSNDSDGTITSSAAATCVLTFGKVFVNPACQVTPYGTTVNNSLSARTYANLTIAAVGAGSVDYHCFEAQ